MPNYLAPNYPTYAQPNAMLGMASGVQNLEAQQMQNRLTAGKIALGNIMAQNINPDGTINQHGVMAAIQANPVVGPYAQEAFLQGQQRPTAVAGTQSAQAGANMAQLQQHVAHLNEVFSLAGSAKTPSDLVRALRFGIDNNAITSQQAADVLNQAPSDPKKLPGYVQALRRAVMTPHEQQLAAYGTPTQVNTGTSVLFGRVSPSGHFTRTSNVKQALPLSTQAEQVKVIAPRGTPGVPAGTPVTEALTRALGQEGINIPTQPSVQQFGGAPGAQGAAGHPSPTAIERFQNAQAQLQALRDQGGAPPAPAGLPHAPGGNSLISPPLARTPQNALTGANGAPIAAYQNPQSAIYANLVRNGVPPGVAAQQAEQAARQVAAQEAGAPQTGYVQTGFAPGVAEARASQLVQGSTLANALESEQAQIPTQRSNLQELRAQLALAAPGPASGILTHYGALWNEMIGGTSAQATAKMLADKGTSWAVQAASAHMGVPTDQKMGLLLEGTPNTNMTKSAALTATGMLLGNVDYMAAKGDAWNTYKQAHGMDADYTRFQQGWNHNVPTASVFQFQHIDPRERSIYWKSLSNKDRTKFLYAAQYTGLLPEIMKDVPHHG